MGQLLDRLDGLDVLLAGLDDLLLVLLDDLLLVGLIGIVAGHGIVHGLHGLLDDALGGHSGVVVLGSTLNLDGFHSGHITGVLGGHDLLGAGLGLELLGGGHVLVLLGILQGLLVGADLLLGELHLLLLVDSLGGGNGLARLQFRGVGVLDAAGHALRGHRGGVVLEEVSGRRWGRGLGLLLGLLAAIGGVGRGGIGDGLHVLLLQRVLAHGAVVLGDLDVLGLRHRHPALRGGRRVGLLVHHVALLLLDDAARGLGGIGGVHRRLARHRLLVLVQLGGGVLIHLGGHRVVEGLGAHAASSILVDGGVYLLVAALDGAGQHGGALVDADLLAQTLLHELLVLLLLLQILLADGLGVPEGPHLGLDRSIGLWGGGVNLVAALDQLVRGAGSGGLVELHLTVLDVRGGQ